MEMCCSKVLKSFKPNNGLSTCEMMTYVAHNIHSVGVLGDRLFWPPRHPVLWRLRLQYHALYELWSGELWKERRQLHILRPAEIQLLPPLLLLWTYNDFWQVSCPGEHLSFNWKWWLTGGESEQHYEIGQQLLSHHSQVFIVTRRL